MQKGLQKNIECYHVRNHIENFKRGCYEEKSCKSLYGTVWCVAGIVFSIF